jgi:predicted DNA-binding protein with PD1-like motif
MTTSLSRSAHTVFLRLAPGDSLIDALHTRLRDGAVATGTLQGHGIIEDTELRTFSADARGLGQARRIAGPVHVLAAFGTVGMSEGSPQVTLRAVLSRETDSGLETLSGVVTQARVVAFEAMVVSVQDLALPLSFDPRAGVPMLDVLGTAAAAVTGARTPSPAPAWVEAVATSNAQPPLKLAPMQAQLPARPPPKPVQMDEHEQIFPEAGDEVQHFAFGRCEVVKSDGDRLHLRVGKDARVREIALEMLKVVLLDADATVRPRHFRLDRRM